MLKLIQTKNQLIQSIDISLFWMLVKGKYDTHGRVETKPKRSVNTLISPLLFVYCGCKPNDRVDISSLGMNGTLLFKSP